MLRRIVSLLFVTTSALAQAPPEYRAFWVETFNTPLGTRAHVEAVVDAAARSNANALFVQVRRRGDSWYIESREPLTEVSGVGEPDASGRWTFDPLAYLIEQAQARSIEVHAFVIVGAVYNSDPATRLPSDSNHVFLRHIWDRDANAPYFDAQQWATRALPHNTSGTSYDGYRFGTEWYIDLGHPDAAAYTVDVLAHLARHYEVDGVHLDRIRYPEAPIDRPSGEPAGINVGYNPTSVARFNERHGRSGNPQSNDPLWNDWRREQVTTFVRNLHITLKSIRPSIRLSAALITFGNGPANRAAFKDTEAYWRVFQDWARWVEEGTLDLVMPMIYKREHSANESAQFDVWLRFLVTLAHSRNRLAVAGLGAYLNGVEGTLRQARRARALSADGVIFYSLANSSAAVTANPFSFPAPGLSTPARTFDEFAAALESGASGSTRFESPALEPLFAQPAPPPRCYVCAPRRRAAGR